MVLPFWASNRSTTTSPDRQQIQYMLTYILWEIILNTFKKANWNLLFWPPMSKLQSSRPGWLVTIVLQQSKNAKSSLKKPSRSKVIRVWMGGIFPTCHSRAHHLFDLPLSPLTCTSWYLGPLHFIPTIVSMVSCTPDIPLTLETVLSPFTLVVIPVYPWCQIQSSIYSNMAAKYPLHCNARTLHQVIL